MGADARVSGGHGPELAGGEAELGGQGTEVDELTVLRSEHVGATTVSVSRSTRILVAAVVSPMRQLENQSLVSRYRTSRSMPAMRASASSMPTRASSGDGVDEVATPP